MVIYLDANCFNRPFDDQSQARIHQETEAVFRLLGRIETGEDKLAWSAALTLELSAHPEPEIRQQLMAWSNHADKHVSSAAAIRQRTVELAQFGVKPLDAAHVAFAEAAGCEVLLTCDDRMLQRARKLNLSLRDLNPVEYMDEVNHGRNND